MIKIVLSIIIGIVALCIFILSVSYITIQAYDFYRVHFCEMKRKKTGAPFTTGNIIVRALKKYEQNEGTYPSNLQSLVPKYIERIPKPNWGVNYWDYTITKEGNGFALSVRVSEDNYICHIYEDGSWWYDS